MKLGHAIALLLIPVLGVAFSVLACWWQRARDTLFVLMVTLAVWAERLDVNFFSEAWYRGTTRGIQVCLLHIFAGALLVGCLVGRRDEGRRWFWPKSLGVMLLYFFYAAVTVIASEQKLFGAFELSKMLGAILVFVSSAIYLRSRREWTILLYALGATVAFEGAWAIKQKLITRLDRVAGTLDHANSLSMYLCLTAPPLVAAAYAGWTVALRRFCGVCAVLAAVGLLLTVSRAGIPVFTFAVLGTLIACASWKLSTKMIVQRLALAAAGVALVAALWAPITRRYAEASLQEEYLDVHVDGRGIYLRLAKNIASEHFFGIGLNSWSYQVSRTYGPQLGFNFEDYDYLVSVYGTDDIEKVFGDSYLAAPAHNLAALTLGELGIPGLLIFLFMWARWFSLGLPFFFDPRSDPNRMLGVGLFFSVCGIFGQSVTEWVFRQTPILLTCQILLGALASLAAVRYSEKKAKRAAAVAVVPIAEPVPSMALASQGV